ncbi:GNAT family N-acetyltransferase [Streptomyces sp. ACA25]|uniref:GNAT family N-acetyltransferase n=1 Tax=Streptomyces sp. ACA25 TaxID=3022596 RepID=UPI0023080ED8|nr:GNAT family N-acetyltransferase [Streptomyces sp. ACA25]MDB1089756.1 GNAT family N-acetyltransferase [Streptomyces sp. ACA25]
MTTDVNIIDAEGRSRFEALSDGKLVGYLEYRRAEDTADYLHTFVSRREREHGVGGELVRAALDDAWHRGLKVKPSCGFVADWISRHPDYGPLLK